MMKTRPIDLVRVVDVYMNMRRYVKGVTLTFIYIVIHAQ